MQGHFSAFIQEGQFAPLIHRLTKAGRAKQTLNAFLSRFVLYRLLSEPNAWLPFRQLGLHIYPHQTHEKDETEIKNPASAEHAYAARTAGKCRRKCGSKV